MCVQYKAYNIRHIITGGDVITIGDCLKLFEIESQNHENHLSGCVKQLLKPPSEKTWVPKGVKNMFKGPFLTKNTFWFYSFNFKIRISKGVNNLFLFLID